MMRARTMQSAALETVMTGLVQEVVVEEVVVRITKTSRRCNELYLHHMERIG